ncbi:hypothetical protein EalM132_00119 [Exiguobacterium phage vB_EalM-132]|nr:hypothetical protein EalM132_00119 [Exiguobacterium phage vB_EalM-132]
MSKQATVSTVVKIDVSTDGVSLTFEGLDADLASLIANAIDYEVVGAPEYHTYDSSNIVIKSKKSLAFVDRTELDTLP